MKKIFSLLLLVSLFSACSLDVIPETDLTDASFWKSEKDIRNACNRLYIDLPGFTPHDRRADDLNNNAQDLISSGNWGIPGKSDDWTTPYTSIGVCNNIITKTATASLSDDVKNRWIAEARFFRAFYYFELVKKYGDVPLILKVFNTTSDPDISRARDPRETVIQQCYNDLDFAYKWLPGIDKLSSATDWGRVSQSAAMGMLVRIGLYEGTHKKYHQTPGGDYRTHLKRAIDAAETMIYNEKKHDLYNNFTNLFQYVAEGPTNKENVFVKVYLAPTLVHLNSGSMNGNAYLTRSMLDNFLYIDGLPRDKSPLRVKPEIRVKDIYTNRDPRLLLTLRLPGDQGSVAIGDNFLTPYRPFKTDEVSGFGYAIKKGFIRKDADSGGKEGVDCMIIRYAEILISYAEALYEYNGSITNLKLEETINKVRGRVGFNVKLTNEFVQQSGLKMLDEIRRERMVEFIDERLHYDDIIRWKTAEKVLPQPVLGLLYNYDDTGNTIPRVTIQSRLTDANGYFNGVKVYDQGEIYILEEASSRKFSPAKDYLYPVPTYEIGTSGGQITQNPGW